MRCEIRQPLTFAPLPEEQKAAALREYEANRSGALVSNFLEARAFVKSRPEETIPGLQLFFLMTLPPDYPEAGATNRARHHVHRLHQSAPEPRRGHAGLGDPLDRPVIDPNYLSHSDEVAPGAHLRSDADLESFVRRTASTTWHPAGTCKMGHDAMAVVDSRLKVHAIEGLRAVDASIMPTIVSGNTNAPTIMIAEKAADLLRNG